MAAQGPGAISGLCASLSLGPNGEPIRECLLVGDMVEVFDAEILGALEGAQAAVEHVKRVGVVWLRRITVHTSLCGQ